LNRFNDKSGPIIRDWSSLPSAPVVSSGILVLAHPDEHDLFEECSLVQPERSITWKPGRPKSVNLRLDK